MNALNYITGGFNMICPNCGLETENEVCEYCGTRIISENVSNGNAFNQQDYPVDYDSMEGHQFEFFCGELLKKNGYTNVEVTRGSGDQGIDILAVKEGVKYGIQCKCYSSDIGNKAVQEVFSGKSFYGCHVAAVLTNRYFTRSAKDLAANTGVLLWDRDVLNSLIENSGGIPNFFLHRPASVSEARSVIQPYIYTEYLKILYRRFPNDRMAATQAFSSEQNLNYYESKRIVDDYYNSVSAGFHSPTTAYRNPKNKWISFFLCLFTICGHKFYEGKIGMGILYFCTVGLFGIGWIIDLITIALKPNTYYV